MIRQSKTTMKELSAQYRSVLKRAFFAGVIAMTTHVANATVTDVTFAGNYTNTSGATVNIADAVAAQSYSYEKSDGSTRDVANQATDPTLTDFTYTDKDGNAANLSTGTKVQSDFTGTTAASGIVSTTQDIVSGATVVRDNYTYTNGAGDTVTLGTAAQNMVQNVDMDATYASGHTIVVTNDETPETVNGTWYTATISDETYHLSADGTKLVNSHDIEVTPSPSTPLDDAFTAMKAAFAADTAAVATASTTTTAQWADEQTNFTAANAAFTTDTTTVATLDTRWGTYETAAGLLATAQANQTAAQDAYTANGADLALAQSIYDAPIVTTITNGANDAIDESVASGSIKSALDAKANVTDVATNTSAIATNTTDIATNATNIAANTSAIATNTADIATNASAIATETTRATAAESALDTRLTIAESDILAEASARSAGDTLTLNTAKTYTDDAIANAGTLMLKSAKDYTDKKVDHLEKELSAGIASAAALSSVTIPTVKKGQLGFGAGYGYHNSQSAIAFGAAMGLTNNWSVNMGTGISNNSATFRAGTTYIIDLF